MTPVSHMKHMRAYCNIRINIYVRATTEASTCTSIDYHVLTTLSPYSYVLALFNFNFFTKQLTSLFVIEPKCGYSPNPSPNKTILKFNKMAFSKISFYR